ncbi:MAG: CARDB domain-containing protein [Candidatus Thorarchaeota archaeon]
MKEEFGGVVSSKKKGVLSTYYETVRKALNSDKAKTIFSLVTVGIIIGPITQPLMGDDERWYSVDELPKEIEWFNGDLNRTVKIHITDIGPMATYDKLTLVVTFNFTGDFYSNVLFVNSESYGFIEYKYTIFTIPATDEVLLEFGARDLWMRIEVLGVDGIVRNDLDDVIIKGKTYWEEYQRYWSGDYWGHRSIITLPEPDVPPQRHSVNITSPDGVTLKHMAVTEEGIYDYNTVTTSYRNITLRSDSTFYKVWTNDSNFYRLQFNWMEPDDPPFVEIHSDLVFDLDGGETRSGEEDPITLSDDTPDEGDIVEIQVNVENSGDAGSGFFNITTYLDRVNSTTLIGNNVSSLGTGHSTTIYFYWNTTGTYGNHTIRAILDQDNYVHEWNESNHASVPVFVNSTKLYQDADNDTLPDAWEDEWGLNKSDASGINGTYGDPDQDGLYNLAEYENNTLPLVSDTDNDTLLDGDNNTLALLKLVMLEENRTFDDHRFYVFVSRFETSVGDDFPYGGYRLPSLYTEYFNTSVGQPNENLSKSYIVKEWPIEVYNKGNATPQGVFYITADKVNLSDSSETSFDFENENIKIRVNASLILNATSDPDPLVKDMDWDGLEDAWEMVYLDTRFIDFRGVDSDSDGVEDLLDVDSDNDHRTDGGDLRLFYFPTYEEEQYDYPLVQGDVQSHNQVGFGLRYPEFGINHSSEELPQLGITDPEDLDSDADSLLDGDEPRIYKSDPKSWDTDSDGMNDGNEVLLYYFYDNASINETFFDSLWSAKLNLSFYLDANYKSTIHAIVRTNSTTHEDIEDSIKIELEENTELMCRLTELEYTVFYDSSGLDDDYERIPVLFNFSFETFDEETPWIRITPDSTIFPKTLSEFEVYLDYAVTQIKGSDVANGDTDGDGLGDWKELQMGTSISKKDTDSDMIWDNAEAILWDLGSMPTFEEAANLRDADVDDDGLIDGFEVLLYDTDPEEADEDNDLLLDGEEVQTHVTMWKHILEETPILNMGTLSHQFAVSAKGEFILKMTFTNFINRSITKYDEDRLYDNDYMDEMNTWFMNNSSTVKYCHNPAFAPEYCRTVKYDSDAIIVNVTRYGFDVNTTEIRKVYIFQNITKKPIGVMGSDTYRMVYDLNVLEMGTVAFLNFTEFYAGRRGVNPFNSDFDGDGLIDGLEFEVGSNPFFAHSDIDMLSDFDEYNGTYGEKTNLTQEDTDQDGLWDGTFTVYVWSKGEVAWGTDATNPDTDGDGLQDGSAVEPDPTKYDYDGDSIADGWEYYNGLNPLDPSDAPLDNDIDGLNNSQEFVADTDPFDKDVDDDKLWDGEEIWGVLYRTNVSDGAISIDNYESQEGYKWLFYNETSHKKYQYNDQAAETWWVVSDQYDPWYDTQDNPKIYGDYIVWEDDRNSNWDIYYFNMSSKTETRVTDESADQRYPEIFGDIIVWQDKRNPDEDWDIWTYNITTAVESRITDNESAQTDPAIFGDTVVWVDKRNGTEEDGYQTEIYGYDLGEELELRMTNNSHNQTAPAIYGNTLVWLDDNYSSWDVYVYQPSGSRYLVNDSSDQRNPRIHGTSVVWEDYRDGNWEIYLHELITNNQTRITNIVSEQKNVDVYNDKLIWEDYRDGNAEIYLYNITTKVKVKITDDNAAQTKPAIFEDRFVWVDERNNSEDIYLYNLTQFGSLGDGAPLFYNPIREEVYVWKPDDTYYRFNETDSSEPCTITVPTIGYREMEIYEGPNIRHPDSDFDGLLDGRNSTVDIDSELYFYYLNYSLQFIDNEDGTGTFVGEKSVFSNPIRADSDNDLLKDAKEVYGYNVSIKRANGSTEEEFVYTHPSNDDCDNDGLIDGREISFLTDPTHPDADDDDVIDGYNVTTTTTSDLFTYFNSRGIRYLTNPDTTVTFVGELSVNTSPTNNESDGDGLDDGQEVFDNYTNPASIDTDDDSIPDGYESYYGLNPLANDTDGDFDGDNFTNVNEYRYGTNPRFWDTDSDGLPDAWEYQYGLSPTDDGEDLYQREHNTTTNVWSYDVLTDQGVADNGPDADVDDDGLDNLQEYLYMKPANWDETQEGIWRDGLPPDLNDADGDTILDGAEYTERTYWWEAENYSANDPVEDSSNGASGGYAAGATSGDDEVFEIEWNLPTDDPDPHYKVMIKARKVGGSDGTLEVYEGINLLGKLTIDKSTYDWYSIAGLEFDKEGSVTVKGIDGESTKPSLYVDKVLLLNVSYLYIDEVCSNKNGQCAATKDLDFDAGGGFETLYVRIPVAGGVPRYVIRAFVNTSGHADFTDDPYLLVGDKQKQGTYQWAFFGEYKAAESDTTLDLSGEFNQYILNNTDTDDGYSDSHIAIPLKFHSDNGGILKIKAVYVRLWPFVSDPNDLDTDSDDLLDWEEIRSFNTSSLRWDSDNDEISDWSEPNEDQGDPDGDQFTDPTDSDTDDDLEMDDDDADPTVADGDKDGLIDGREFRLNTKPDDPDTDDDRLLDGYNITMSNTSEDFSDFFTTHNILWVYLGGGQFTFLGEMSLGTKPTVADTDGDEQEDGEEWEDGTSFLDIDTDSDRLLDGYDLTIQESDDRYDYFVERGIVYKGGKFKGDLTAGSDPTVTDTDDDGLPDGWEVKFGLSPTDDGSNNIDNGPYGDPDDDNVINIDEYDDRTDPQDEDTDGDELPDEWESTFSLDPLHDGSYKYVLRMNYDYEAVANTNLDDGAGGDPDGDYVINIDEYDGGTSPQNADSDCDGLIDGGTVITWKNIWRSKLWISQGLPFTNQSGYEIEFVGENAYLTNPTNSNSDGDNLNDGQEVFGYDVSVSWYEDEELKSKNKTIFGHPWGKYVEPDNTTLLDMDEDGITDIDEIDPKNSLTDSVVDYVNEFGDNQTAMDSQFNALVRENVPPAVFNVKIKSMNEWGTCYFLGIAYDCIKRRYADISVDALDVSQFEITIKLEGDFDRSVTLEGKGRDWYATEIDISEWEALTRYKVIVEMVDFAGNELDPRYEKEIDGFFGGVLRFLEALWDFLAGIAGAIADAVMKAVSFLIEMIGKGLSDLVKAIFDPLWQDGRNPSALSFIDSMTLLLDELADETEEPQSGPGGQPIGRSSKGPSGLGWMPAEEPEENHEDDPLGLNLKWAEKVVDGIDEWFAYGTIFSATFLIATLIIGALMEAMWLIAAGVTALVAVVLMGWFMSIIPVESWADVPTNQENVRNYLEDYNTEQGPAALLFNTLLLCLLKLKLGPFIMGGATWLYAFTIAVSITSIVVAALLTTDDFESNVALSVVALALVLQGMTLVLLTAASIFNPTNGLSIGVKVVMGIFLVVFFGGLLMSMASLLGYISKNQP